MRPNIDEETAEELEARADAIAGVSADTLGVGQQIQIVISELDDEKHDNMTTKELVHGAWYKG